MGQSETLYVCMGSACHQYGVYDVLPVLQRLLAERAPDSQVALKGAFCLGPCMDGIILKLGDVTIVHVNANNIEQKFEDEILPYLTREKN